MAFFFPDWLTPASGILCASTASLAGLVVRNWLAGRHTRNELAEYKRSYSRLSSLSMAIEQSTSHKAALGHQLNSLKAQVASYGQMANLARVGLYAPVYSLPDESTYRKAILECRERQKAMVKAFTAVSHLPGADSSKESLAGPRLALRLFNLECDNTIGRVTPNNYGDCVRRIQKAFELANASAEQLHFEISLEYLQEKNKELQLAFECLCKKAEALEAARAERSRQRQEEREAVLAADELDAAERNLAAVQEKLSAAEAAEQAPANAQNDRLFAEIQSLRDLVTGGEARKERALSMAQKTKAGYVYIISNVGSFGENMFKVGMTRRLDPMDRVIELGDAAVPFTFDVHAFIYSDDAPALENSLHTELRGFAVNKVNPKKEFFYTTLERIEAAVNKFHGPFKLNRDATALEYRQSLALSYPDEYAMPSTAGLPLPFVSFSPAAEAYPS